MRSEVVIQTGHSAVQARPERRFTGGSGFGNGEFTLLDNSAWVLRTQNGTSTQVEFAPMDHPKQNSPFVVAGSCGGAWTTGRIIDCDGRAHNDVYLSIARAVGMDVDSVRQRQPRKQDHHRAV